MKRNALYKCEICGYTTTGYFGKCPECGSFGSMNQVISESDNKKTSTKKKAKRLPSVETFSGNRIYTGIKEFDRVMGNGVVRDSVSILTAKPGAGKSTILLQVAQKFGEQGLKVLYATGEESETQIKLRAERILDDMSENVWILGSNSLEDVEGEVKEIDADVVIIDSIQTLTSDNLTSRAGTPTQVMECAHALVDLAKNPKRQRTVIIVGQMTKEDELAGVRTLEHLVDTVLLIEVEDNEELRILTATKNRYGAAYECGFFLMKEKGMISLDDPGTYFMTRRTSKDIVPGSTLCISKEGSRYIALEVEALASQSFMAYPSRISDCLKRERLNTLVSIIEERGGVKLYDKNVVVKTSGDIKLRESASNLAAIIAIISSVLKKGISTSTIFIGDVGLTGELKSVPFMEQRIKEAIRLGFTEIYTPKLNFKVQDTKGAKILECQTLRSLCESIF